MEKFSAWRDKGTGISPFMPTEIPKSPVRKYVVDPVLLLVKIPIFFIVYLGAYLFPKQAFNAALSLLFAIDVDLLVEGVRRTKTAEIDRVRPTVNLVVVSNWISPLDVFVLYSVANVASLSHVAVVVPTKTGLYCVDAWQSMWVFFGCDIQTVGEKIASLSAVKDKLVIFFAEGTSSNNKAVLPVTLPENVPVFTYQTAVVKMYPNSLTVPIPTTAREYLVRLLTHGGKGLIKVKLVPMAKVSSGAVKLVYADNGLSTVELGAEQKQQFCEYYRSYALSNITRRK